MSFLIEFFKFLRARRKLWLYPIAIAILLVGLLLVFAPGSAVAPFIYVLF